MITSQQKKNLQQLLSLSKNKEDALTYDELRGFFFGLAICPEIIMPSEWLPVIFGEDAPNFSSMKTAQKLLGTVMDVYNAHVDAFHQRQLVFPFPADITANKQFHSLLDWVFGLEEALLLREEFWVPEPSAEVSEDTASSLSFAVDILSAFNDQETANSMAEHLPEDIVRHLVPDFNPEQEKIIEVLPVFLYHALPGAIDVLLEYAYQQHPAHKTSQKVKKTKKKPTITKLAPAKGATPEPSAGGCPGCAGCTPKQKKGALIRADFGAAKKPAENSRKDSEAVSGYLLKITLAGVKPPVWRKVQVPGEITLLQLHQVIQHSMGWQDSHLHQFIIGGGIYCLPVDDSYFQHEEDRDEREFTLHQLLPEARQDFRYIYDFGDDWLHTITIDKVLPPETTTAQVLLVGGRGACPPEDCGGWPGYLELVDAYDDTSHPDHKYARRLLKKGFDPKLFSPAHQEKANKKLQTLFRS